MKFKYLFIGVLLIFSQCIVHAKTITINEILKSSQSTSNNHTFIDFKEQLIKIKELINKDINKAYKLTKEMLELAKQKNDTVYMLKFSIQLVSVEITLNFYENALSSSDSAMLLAEEQNNYNSQAKINLLKGMIFMDLGDYYSSSKVYFKSLKLYEKEGNIEGITEANAKIGSVYFEQENYDKALEFMFKSLVVAKKNNYKKLKARALNDISAVYLDIGQNEKVIEYLKEAIEINTELKNNYAKAVNYINLGSAYQNIYKSNISLNYFNKALAELEELNVPVLIAKCRNIMSQYFLDVKQYDKAIENAKKAKEIASVYSFKNVSYDAANNLYNIYKIVNDSKNATKYLILKYQLKDSMNIEKSKIKIANLEIRSKYEKEILIKEKSHQKSNYIFIIILMTVLSLLAVILAFFLKQKINVRNNEIKRVKLQNQLDVKNKELTLSVMSQIKKNEILSNISIQLDKIKSDKDSTKQSVSRINKSLKKAIQDDIWKDFEIRFKEVHTTFYDDLLKKHPTLTTNEMRLCSFLRLNMCSKDISELTGQSLHAIEIARYRLRKKLGLSNTKTNLVSFLAKL